MALVWSKLERRPECTITAPQKKSHPFQRCEKVASWDNWPSRELLANTKQKERIQSYPLKV